VNADGSLIVREDITFEFAGPTRDLSADPLRSRTDGLEFPLSRSGIGVYDEASRPAPTEVS